MNGAELVDDERHSAMNIVVVRAENKDFGLIVESVHDTEEIVVKPLGRQVKNIPVFAGATIMGDGKVALILDILGLGREAGIVHQGRDARDEFHEREDGEEHKEKQSLLLVRSGTSGQLGVPIERVDRLEEFSREQIEYASGHEVVQYRGGILPLLNLPRFFGNEAFTRDVYSVVVCTVEDQQVGLIVEAILDILEDSLDIHDAHTRAGISGSAVVQGQVTDILDVAAVLSSELGSVFVGQAFNGMEA
jgi:two-component system chemotaxis sensor kinase CheA